MPYKDPERQRQAQHAQYLRNKERYLENQRQRRAQPGYRDREYEAKRQVPATARPARPSARVTERPPRPAPAAVPRLRPKRNLTLEEQAEARRIEEYAAVQRRLKEDAMRRLGLASVAGGGR